MRIPGADEAAATNGTPQPTNADGPIPREAKSRPAVHAAPPVALTSTPNVAGLLLALRRRWLLALSLGLVCAVVTAIVVWIVRPITFTARTLLHVASIQPRILFDTPDGRTDFGNYQRVQIALVKGRLVLNSALRDPKVESLPVVKQQDDPVTWLERQVQADFSTAPEILRIAMTGENTQELTILVDAIRKAYLVEIVQKENKVRQVRLDQLKKYYADYDGILRDKRETLKRMARSVGSQDKNPRRGKKSPVKTPRATPSY
jgi:hypothetical protein